MIVDWISLLVGLCIIAAVLWVYWNGRRDAGVADAPNRQIRKLFAEVKAIQKTLESTATADDLNLIRSEMKRVEGAAASSGEVLALEGKINVLRAEMQGAKELAGRTHDAVDRIERHLIRKAMDQ
ncbi:hypothetical protein P1X14_16635 [Sphingomonas sp. AOB5]|uniref:hypothetical protein n=1 Tax=Sphingomonas sp. AOB5 TaxID=3034017 RepID=UPI0023F6CE26|nr:hypothetical protein [Sphingomonas sp. AOB5]MDF7776886.1 hypothetical protein [Sphingomonas sp. AOB5]